VRRRRDRLVRSHPLRHNDADVFLYAFDLIELNGEDLRRNPLDVRKATLASLLARTSLGYGSTFIWRRWTARPCSSMPASWAPYR
jgi:ATP-dependent DNA ligase